MSPEPPIKSRQPGVRWLALAAWSCLFFAWSAAPTRAEDPVPIGAEFEIPSAPSTVDNKPRSAANAAGDFVVVWESYPVEYSYGVRGRRFASNGTPIGDSFLVNTYTSNLQVFPDVDCLDSGEFLVIWQSYMQVGTTWGVFAQRFDADAAPVGTELVIAASAESDQHDASVALRSDGGFLVVWDYDTVSDHEIRGQVFDSAGAAAGALLQISTPLLDDDYDPRVASQAGDGFVVVWERTNGDGSGKAVHARRLASDGTFLGSEFQVNAFTIFDQEDPEVAVMDDGRFAVTLESQEFDGSGQAVLARFFDSTGSALGGDVLVNVTTAGHQRNPSVAAVGDDTYVVIWESETGTADGLEVLGRAFDGMGQASTGEFQVAELNAADQYYASVAATAHEGFFVGWVSNDCAGCGRAAKGRVVVFPDIFADGFESGDTSAWSTTVD